MNDHPILYGFIGGVLIQTVIMIARSKATPAALIINAVWIVAALCLMAAQNARGAK